MEASYRVDKKFKHFHLAFVRKLMITIAVWPLKLYGWKLVLYDAFYYFEFFFSLVFAWSLLYGTSITLRKTSIVKGAADLSLSIAYVIALIKAYIWHGETVRELILRVEGKEKIILNRSDEEIKKIYTSSSLPTMKLMKLYVSLGQLGVGAYVLNPLINNWLHPLPFNDVTGIQEKRLVCGNWNPFDENKYFIVTYGAQCISIYFAYGFFIYCDILFVFMTTFTTVRLKILQTLFKKFTVYYKKYSDEYKVSDETAQMMFLKDCIKEHQEIISFVYELNGALSKFNFLNFVISSFQLSLVVVLIQDSTQSTTEKAASTSYFLVITAQLMLYYWYAHEVVDQSEALGQAICDSDWYTYTSEVKKMMGVVIMRSQKPLEFSIGRLYPMRVTILFRIYKAIYYYGALFGK